MNNFYLGNRILQGRNDTYFLFGSRGVKQRLQLAFVFMLSFVYILFRGKVGMPVNGGLSQEHYDRLFLLNTPPYINKKGILLFKKKNVRDHIDVEIRSWKLEYAAEMNKLGKDQLHLTVIKSHLNAFQCLRQSLFGEKLQ